MEHTAVSHVVPLNDVLAVRKVRRISGIQKDAPGNVIFFSEGMMQVIAIIRSLYHRIIQSARDPEPPTISWLIFCNASKSTVNTSVLPAFPLSSSSSFPTTLSLGPAPCSLPLLHIPLIPHISGLLSGIHWWSGRIKVLLPAEWQSRSPIKYIFHPLPPIKKERQNTEKVHCHSSLSDFLQVIILQYYSFCFSFL